MIKFMLISAYIAAQAATTYASVARNYAATNKDAFTTQTYYYPNLKVVVEAANWPEGLPKAARICFQALTRGQYPGEEEGLRIIDVCANPRRQPM